MSQPLLRSAAMTDTTSKSCPSCFKTSRQTDVVGFYRDVPGRVVSGVTAAIALHFNWDVPLMRIAFVVSLAVLGPVPIWIYVAAWLSTPFAQDGKAPLTRMIDWLSNLFSPRPTGVEHVE